MFSQLYFLFIDPPPRCNYFACELCAPTTVGPFNLPSGTSRSQAKLGMKPIGLRVCPPGPSGLPRRAYLGDNRSGHSGRASLPTASKRFEVPTNGHLGGSVRLRTSRGSAARPGHNTILHTSTDVHYIQYTYCITALFPAHCPLYIAGNGERCRRK